MQPVQIGIIGPLEQRRSGHVGHPGRKRARHRAEVGFPCWRCARCAAVALPQRSIPSAFASARKTANWREVVERPDVDIVAELVGGAGVAREIVEGALARGKSVVTANKELMALAGADLWDLAIASGLNLAMEASVAGGIPIHNVLREGISGDRIQTLYGILNGTCNYILTEVESRGASFPDVLAEAQKAGYAEADPSADVDGFDARSKLAILAALAFGERIVPADIYTEGIRRVTPVDSFSNMPPPVASHDPPGVRGAADSGRAAAFGPAVADSSNRDPRQRARSLQRCVWVHAGKFGADTFYYGRGAGPFIPPVSPVASDLMRVAREIRSGSPERVSPFAHARLGEYQPIPVTLHRSAYYLRFRVQDRPGIIAQLAAALAAENISIDAVLQLPNANWRDLPRS